MLLYPPLKGFSHRSDSHIRVESSLFKAPQGDLKPWAFDFTHERVLHRNRVILHQKRLDIVFVKNKWLLVQEFKK